MASVYTIKAGQTLNSHESFKSRLPWRSYKNVSEKTDCDVILAFCPVASRVGTDIEAALREIPEGKPLALVVLHHTIDSNYTVPDTRRFVKRPDSITVDCLFSDDGLMRCPCNDDAVRTVGKFLRQHSKHSLGGKLALGLVLVALIFCVANITQDFTFITDISREKNNSYVSDKTNTANASQRHNFLLFYAKYITKDKCFLGVWGMQQCRTRFTTQQQINYLMKEMEEIRKNNHYLKKELHKQQQDIKELIGNMNSLKQELENQRSSQQQCTQTCLSHLHEAQTVNSQKSLVTRVYDYFGGTTTPPVDINAQLPESSQSAEKEAPTDRAEETKDETDKKDKKRRSRQGRKEKKRLIESFKTVSSTEESSASSQLCYYCAIHIGAPYSLMDKSSPYSQVCFSCCPPRCVVPFPAGYDAHCNFRNALHELICKPDSSTHRPYSTQHTTSE